MPACEVSDPAGLGVSACIGSCKLQCMTLPKTHRLGCESLARTLKARV